MYTKAFRILIVWLCNNRRGSVFTVPFFHATLNLNFMLFPVNGSPFDMRRGGLAIARAAAVVVLFCGHKTLTRHATA